MAVFVLLAVGLCLFRGLDAAPTMSDVDASRIAALRNLDEGAELLDNQAILIDEGGIMIDADMLNETGPAKPESIHVMNDGGAEMLNGTDKSFVNYIKYCDGRDKFGNAVEGAVIGQDACSPKECCQIHSYVGTESTAADGSVSMFQRPDRKACYFRLEPAAICYSKVRILTPQFAYFAEAGAVGEAPFYRDACPCVGGYRCSEPGSRDHVRETATGTEVHTSKIGMGTAGKFKPQYCVQDSSDGA